MLNEEISQSKEIKTHPSEINASREEMDVHQEVDHPALDMAVDVVDHKRAPGIDDLITYEWKKEVLP